MVYTHVLNRGGRGVNSPALIAYDGLILSYVSLTYGRCTL